MSIDLTEAVEAAGRAAPMTGELAKALAAFQTEMPTVTKGKTAKVPTKAGGSYSYSYADLADVTQAAMPLLAKHGLAFSALPERSESGWSLTGVLMHASGEEVRGSLPLVGGGPQEMGSSLTYMRRYLLGCMTGIVTDDDDDGQRAQTAHRDRPARSRGRQPDDEWTTAPPSDIEAARLELAEWCKASGLDLAEALARWAADHDGQHIKDATDAAGLRAMQAVWQQEIDAQRSEP